MKPYLRKHNNIVDLGIGVGGYYLGLDIKKIVGVDRDKILLRTARTVNPSIETKFADVVNTGLSDKTYDLVVLSHILEHVPDYEPIIKEAKRICKEGGYFLIGLPVNHPHKKHYFPRWEREDVIGLALKFGNSPEISVNNDSWLVYVRKT